MKVYLRTWRFGQDTVMEFHGAQVHYDIPGHLLIVREPVLDSRLGDVTAVTITNGDEWTSERCPATCEHHPLEVVETHTAKFQE